MRQNNGPSSSIECNHGMLNPRRVKQIYIGDLVDATDCSHVLCNHLMKLPSTGTSSGGSRTGFI